MSEIDDFLSKKLGTIIVLIDSNLKKEKHEGLLATARYYLFDKLITYVSGCGEGYAGHYILAFAID